MARVILKELLCISVAFLAVAPFNAGATQDLPQTVPVTTVGTLKPAFAWTPPKRPGVSYDLIICAGISDPRGFWVPGKTVYYRQGITRTMHIVDQPLSPDTVYVWSVRTRSGNKTSLWAAYSDDHPSRNPKDRHTYNIMYSFKTPGH
jgi:hypothetical protein